MAAGDLTTAKNVKEWLGSSAATADDAMLGRLVTACSQYVQTWLNRAIAAQTYTEQRDGNGKTRMICADYPVTAVAAVVVDGNAIPPSPDVFTSGYFFDAYSIRLRGYDFGQRDGGVTIQYTAGFSAIPPELEQAVIETVALRYKERDRIGHASKSIGGETVAFTITDFPKSVQTIINNYKKVVPL